MADQVKVRLDKADAHGFSGGEAQSQESGVLVEMPDRLMWLGYHSFAFESSLEDPDLMDEVYKYYATFVGKKIVWEAMQESGRRFKEGDEEYVLLKITDILAYDDDVKSKIKVVTDVRRAGSFKA